MNRNIYNLLFYMQVHKFWRLWGWLWELRHRPALIKHRLHLWAVGNHFSHSGHGCKRPSIHRIFHKMLAENKARSRLARSHHRFPVWRTWPTRKNNNSVRHHSGHQRYRCSQLSSRVHEQQNHCKIIGWVRRSHWPFPTVNFPSAVQWGAC